MFFDDLISNRCASGLKEGVIDIDAVDANNELAEVKYVNDIYKFYHAVEEEGKIVDYMEFQPHINANMRSTLVDWLIDIHGMFKLTPETLYLTVNLIDRFLSFQVISREEFQLLGLSAMLIASKYEEDNRTIDVSEFVWISDDGYCREQILAMEKSILGQLEWYITVPTPYVFLPRYLKASVPCDMEMENLVFYLAELGLMHYELLVLNYPSLLAASAVYAARLTLRLTPSWTKTLMHHTGYLERDIREPAVMLLRLRDSIPRSSLKAAFTKYCKNAR